MMLAAVLFLTGVVPILGEKNAAHALTTYQKVTKYHLDMGIAHIWRTGEPDDEDLSSVTWQGGLEYGKKTQGKDCQKCL
ncbi:MAG: hypothetical protein PHE79_11195 [Eubacteriales bacterium]|nr:hypothetical protein [Eubacteriales bacterium]